MHLLLTLTQGDLDLESTRLVRDLFLKWVEGLPLSITEAPGFGLLVAEALAPPQTRMTTPARQWATDSKADN